MAPVWGWLVLAVSLAGCGGDGNVEIRGTASFNGEPIETGYLELEPLDASGQFASAEISKGRFTLRTSPGPRRLRVTAQRKIGETESTERIPNPEPIMEQYLPTKFNSQSEMEIEIRADDPRLTLDLDGEESATAQADASEQRRRAQQGGQ